MSKKNKVSEAKTGYYGYRSETNTSHDRKTVKSLKTKKGNGGKALGIVLIILQLAASIGFVWLFLSKGFAFATTGTVFGIIAVLIVLLALVLFLLQKSKNAQTVGKIISFIVIILLLLGCYYLSRDLSKFTTGDKLGDTPFVVFVSANDTFGAFDEKTLGRSDTNILAVVNPENHNVLMISTPRDYYVPVQAKAVAPESYDKLTHVGLYGRGTATKKTDGSNATASDWQWAYEVNWKPGNKALMDTLKYLYKINVTKDHYHYVKINFTGFAELIDAMGGITVNVDQPFSTTTYASYGDKDTGERKTYTYHKGKMEMDGATALTFARERHSFGNGDMQRNRNQVKVLKAIQKKALSGNTLLHYNSILDAIDKCFATNIDISSSINLLRDGGSDGWNIMSFSVTGTSSRQICTYTGTSLSVVMQDEASVNRARNLIQMTLDGKTTQEIKKQIKTYNKEQGN